VGENRGDSFMIFPELADEIQHDGVL